MLPDGPIKTMTLRGIKDSPPYLHDGRLMTLADTVAFFNLTLRLKLSQQEKDDRRLHADPVTMAYRRHGSEAVVDTRPWS